MWERKTNAQQTDPREAGERKRGRETVGISTGDIETEREKLARRTNV